MFDTGSSCTATDPAGAGQPEYGSTAAATVSSSSSVADPVTATVTPSTSRDERRLVASRGQPLPGLAADLDVAPLLGLADHVDDRAGPGVVADDEAGELLRRRQVADLERDRVTLVASPASVRALVTRKSSGRPSGASTG